MGCASHADAWRRLDGAAMQDASCDCSGPLFFYFSVFFVVMFVGAVTLLGEEERAARPVHTNPRGAASHPDVEELEEMLF